MQFLFFFYITLGQVIFYYIWWKVALAGMGATGLWLRAKVCIEFVRPPLFSVYFETKGIGREVLYQPLVSYYTRFSCYLKVKNNIYPISSLPTGWTNGPTNEFHVSKLKWRQFFPCHNIRVYSTFILSVNFHITKYEGLKQVLQRDTIWSTRFLKAKLFYN